MSLNSWAERLRRQTAYGSDVDERFIPAMVARLQQALRSDEEDRIARRADREAARAFREAQLAETKRQHERGAVDDVLGFLTQGATRTGPLWKLPDAVPDAITSGLAPDQVEAVRAAALAKLMGFDAKLTDERAAKAEAKREEEDRFKRQATFSHGLSVDLFRQQEAERSKREKPGEKPMTYEDAARFAKSLLERRYFDKATQQFVTTQPTLEQIQGLLPRIFEANRAHLGAAAPDQEPAPTGAPGEVPFWLRAQVSPDEALARTLAPTLAGASGQAPPAAGGERMVMYNRRLVPWSSLPPDVQAKVLARLGQGQGQ